MSNRYTPGGNYQKNDDDEQASNVSYGSNDDETILTATITFDVTVDQDGQVINTSEGQIISETIDNDRGGNLSNHYFGQNQLSQYNQYHQIQPQDAAEEPMNENPIQADSLASIGDHSQRKDKSILQDSLDELDHDNENETDDESTTTESLIERSKKYMDKEAGIIVLRRDSDEPKNFNINLDFDIKDKNKIAESENKDFNISMDFDVQNKKDSDFNIDLDFDVRNKNQEKKEKLNEDFDINMDFDIRNRSKIINERTFHEEKHTEELKDFNIDINMALQRENEIHKNLILDNDSNSTLANNPIFRDSQQPSSNISGGNTGTLADNQFFRDNRQASSHMSNDNTGNIVNHQNSRDNTNNLDDHPIFRDSQQPSSHISGGNTGTLADNPFFRDNRQASSHMSDDNTGNIVNHQNSRDNTNNLDTHPIFRDNKQLSGHVPGDNSGTLADHPIFRNKKQPSSYVSGDTAGTLGDNLIYRDNTNPSSYISGDNLGTLADNPIFKDNKQPSSHISGENIGTLADNPIFRNNVPASEIIYEENSFYEGVDDDEEITKINRDSISENVYNQDENLEEYFKREVFGEKRNESEIIDQSQNRHEGYKNNHFKNGDIKECSKSAMDSTGLAQENARMDLINRMVEKSMEKNSTADKEEFYKKNVEKVKKFSLEDCIEMLLDDKDGKATKSEQADSATDIPVLRPFETVDFEALTKGFEQEDVKEGTLVLYITEAQLMQLLKQRAIIIPDKTKLLTSLNNEDKSVLFDDKIKKNLGRESPVDRVELVIDDLLAHVNGDRKPEQDRKPLNSYSQDSRANSVTKEQSYDLQNRSSKITTDNADRSITESSINNNVSSSILESPRITENIAHSTHTTSVTDTQISEEFVNDVLGLDLKDLLKKDDLYDKSLNIISDVVEKVIDDTKRSSISNDTQKRFENFYDNIEKDNNSARTKISPTNSINELISNISSDVDNANGSAQILDTLADFVDKVASKDTSENRQTERTLSKIKDFVIDTLGTDGKQVQDKQIRNSFINSVFGEDLANDLKEENLEKIVTNRVQDLIDKTFTDSKIEQKEIEKTEVFKDFFEKVTDGKRENIASESSIEKAVSNVSEVFDQALYSENETEKRGPSPNKVVKTLADFVDRVTRNDERILSNSQSNEALEQIRSFSVEDLKASQSFSEKMVFEEFLTKTFGGDLLQEFKDANVDENAFNIVADLVENVVKEGAASDKYFEHPSIEKGKTFEKLFAYVSSKKEGQSYQRKNIAQSEKVTQVIDKIAAIYDTALIKSGKRSLHPETNPLKNLKFLGDFVERVLENHRGERLFSDKLSNQGLEEIKEYTLDLLGDFRSTRSSTLNTHSHSSRVSTQSAANDNDFRVFEEFFNKVSGDKMKRLVDENRLEFAYNKIQDLVDLSTKATNDSSNESLTRNGQKFKKFFENISSGRYQRSSQSNPSDIESYMQEIQNIYSLSSTNEDNQLSSAEAVVKTLGDFYNRVLDDQALSRGLTNEESDSAIVVVRDYVFNELEKMNIFDKFVDNILGDKSIEEIKKIADISVIYNKIQDLLDGAFVNQIDSSNDSLIENSKIFKDFFNTKASNKKRTIVGDEESIIKTIEDVSNILGISSLVNGSETASEKFRKFLGDFINRVTKQNQNILTDDLSNKVFDRIREYILDKLCDDLNDDNVNKENVFKSFKDALFAPESLEILQDKNDLIEKAFNKVQDLFDKSLSNVEKENGTMSPKIGNAKIFRDFFENEASKAPELNLRRKSVACESEIEEAEKRVSKIVDQSPLLTEQDKTLTDSENFVKTLEDFVDRVEENQSRRTLTDELSNKAIDEIRRFSLEKICGNDSPQEADAQIIFDKFMEKMFSPESLEKLKTGDLIGRVYNKVQDLVDGAITSVEEHQRNGSLGRESDAQSQVSDGHSIFADNPFFRDNRQASSHMSDDNTGNIVNHQNSRDNTNNLDDHPIFRDSQQPSSHISGGNTGTLADNSFFRDNRQASNHISDDNTGNLVNHPILRNNVQSGKKFKEFFNELAQTPNLKIKREKIASDKSITETIKKVSDVFKRSPLLSESDKNSVPAENFLKTLGDFIDRVTDQPQRLLTNDLSDRAISEITDFVLKDLCSPTSTRSVASRDGSLKYTQKSPEQIEKEYELENQRRISSIGSIAKSTISSYETVLGDGSTVPKFPDNQLLNFKDFDMLVTPSRTSKVSGNRPVAVPPYIETADVVKPSYEPGNTVKSSDYSARDSIKSDGLPTYSTYNPEDTKLDNYQSYIPNRDSFISTILPDQYKFLATPDTKTSTMKAGNTTQIKPQQEPRKILIKATRRLPGKTCPPPKKGTKYSKKKITYSYLDNYTPSTRVYEILDWNPVDRTDESTKDLFDLNKKNGYSFKPFDSAISQSIGKPSVDKINEYFSVVNTGVDSDADLYQIHPLLNSMSEVTYQNNMTNPKKETVNIQSDGYDSYFADIEKQFKCLNITDFPIYVQGLEFRNSINTNDPQSEINSNNCTESKGFETELGHQSETYTKQTVNNVDNVQYVRVLSDNNLKSAQ